MNHANTQPQAPEVWRPLAGMPDGAQAWRMAHYEELAEEWTSIRAALKNREEPRAFLDKWLEERGRAFAIETGQIEGLYTLKAGITERLVAEGLAGVVGAHTVENIEDATVKGLLADQETAYNMLFEDVASGRPLTQHAVKSWHQLVTRHQETVAGLTIPGARGAGGEGDADIERERQPHHEVGERLQAHSSWLPLLGGGSAPARAGPSSTPCLRSMTAIRAA